MELHQVRYFLAVCRTLNFTRAAEDCNVAQPSLTRAIQKLEEEFGGLLFHRERANTHLTELGRAMQPLLDRADISFKEMQVRVLAEVDTLTISAQHSTMVSDIHAVNELLRVHFFPAAATAPGSAGSGADPTQPGA